MLGGFAKDQIPLAIDASRLASEERHSALIQHRAEEIWGWATPAGQRRARRRADYFMRLANLGPEQKVLELGCGTGVFTALVAGSGAAITATDLSEALLEQARTKNIPGASFQKADAHQLQFLDGAFDVVFGSSILHHLDLGQALAEIHRVLKLGGRMVFAEPNMLNPQILIQKNVPFVKRLLGDTPDETAFVRWSLARRLQQAGFSEIRIFPYDFLHPLTPAPLVTLVELLGKTIEQVPLLREIAGSLVISAQKDGAQL